MGFEDSVLALTALPGTSVWQLNWPLWGCPCLEKGGAGAAARSLLP